MVLTEKLTTAKRVYDQQGVPGVYAVIRERIAAVAAHIRRWWWSDHPLLGRLVEWRGNMVEVDGLKFSVDHPSISRGVKGLFVLDRYEKAERLALRTWIRPEAPVIELGGSIGVVSCLTNRLLKHKLNHVVVEANPDLIPLLIANRDRNGCAFTVLLGAVSYQGKVTEFMVSDSILASSATKMDPRCKVARTVRVPSITLKEIIEQRAFYNSDCTLICDIECGEVDLVRNEIETIRRHVSTILMEVHTTTLDEPTVAGLVQSLEDAGFALTWRIRKTFIFDKALKANG